MRHFLFPQPGSIPGIPGLFTGHITIMLDGTIIAEALTQHLDFEPAAAPAPSTISDELPPPGAEDNRKRNRTRA